MRLTDNEDENEPVVTMKAIHGEKTLASYFTYISKYNSCKKCFLQHFIKKNILTSLLQTVRTHFP